MLCMSCMDPCELRNVRPTALSCFHSSRFFPLCCLFFQVDDAYYKYRLEQDCLPDLQDCQLKDSCCRTIRDCHQHPILVGSWEFSFVAGPGDSVWEEGL